MPTKINRKKSKNSDTNFIAINGCFPKQKHTVLVKMKNISNHGLKHTAVGSKHSHILPEPYSHQLAVPENDVDYQWKGLQVAERVLSQVDIMPYFIHSTNFTPEWLSTFLVAFEKEVECIRLNYYQSGNILISQYQAVATAGMLMPGI